MCCARCFKNFVLTETYKFPVYFYDASCLANSSLPCFWCSTSLFRLFYIFFFSCLFFFRVTCLQARVSRYTIFRHFLRQSRGFALYTRQSSYWYSVYPIEFSNEKYLPQRLAFFLFHSPAIYNLKVLTTNRGYKGKSLVRVKIRG